LALSEAATPEGGVDWLKYGELAKKKFCGMRVREAVRYVGLDKIMKPEIKHNGWPGPFGDITEAVSRQTLETLPFSNRAIQGLKAMGVMTIGDATRICAIDLLKVRNVGRNTIQEIYGTIRMAVSSETEVHIVTDSVDVVMTQFPFVPARSKGLPEQFYLDFFSELPAVIKKYEGSEEEIILCSRLFCSSENRKTLDVVGKRIGKTRERVRQEETDLMLKLKASLFDGKYTYNKIGKNKSLAFGKVRFIGDFRLKFRLELRIGSEHLTADLFHDVIFGVFLGLENLVQITPTHQGIWAIRLQQVDGDIGGPLAQKDDD
jgi:hypothetical protein